MYILMMGPNLGKQLTDANKDQFVVVVEVRHHEQMVIKVDGSRRLPPCATCTKP